MGGRSTKVLGRIREALGVANGILERFVPGEIESRRKSGGDPVTEADLAVDRALRDVLVREGEGWLSEETADLPERLERSRIWVVDPIDGTKEFIRGIPEWCVSIGYVVDGEAVAGGILNPATKETFLGQIGVGVTRNGNVVRVRDGSDLDGTTVLASRSEVSRGEWAVHDQASFTIRPMGSVAYKLALVAAGAADATWTLVPKNEWDVAAGTALVRAAGGAVRTKAWREPRFNRDATTRLDGLVAAGADRMRALQRYLGRGGGRGAR